MTGDRDTSYQDGQSPENPIPQITTPHQKLLGDIFGMDQYPVPQQYQVQIQQAVEEWLETISNFRQGTAIGMIRKRYGLDGEEPMTLKRIGESDQTGPVSNERARQIISKGKRMLWHPSRRGQVQDYLTVPPESLGKELFQAVIRKELPENLKRRGKLTDAFFDRIPGATWSEVANVADIFGYIYAENLLMLDLSQNPLSESALSEIAQLFRKAKEQMAAEQPGQSPA